MTTVAHNGIERPLEVGKTIFDYADELAVQVPTSCYRTGHCHECVVDIKAGMEGLSPRTEAESFLKENYRLACQAVIERDDLAVEFSPLRRKPKILTQVQDKDVELAPMVTRVGEDILYDGEVIDQYRGHVYGLAIDLGTTTVVMDLVDLETGSSIHVSSFENPQRFGGSDVMNRISYDGTKHRGELQKAIASAISKEILDMSQQHGFARQEIYEIVVAGNSTMREILFKIDVQSIGQRPYKSSVEEEFLAGDRANTALLQEARRLGLRANPKTKVYGLPLIASHVGADTAADLVALDMDTCGEDEVVMLVDVGTNTEVVVSKALTPELLQRRKERVIDFLELRENHEVYRAIFAFDLGERMREIRVPTLIIEVRVPSEAHLPPQGELLKALVPDSHLATVENPAGGASGGRQGR